MDTQVIIKILADWLVIPVVGLGVFAFIRYVPRSRMHEVYARTIMMGLTSYGVAKIASLIYQPNTLRPFELMGVEAGASFLNNPGFPSDHVLFTMVITLAIFFGARTYKIATAALILTILVAIGRVLANVHTPIDVIGGFILAFVGILWYLPFSKKSTSVIFNNPQKLEFNTALIRHLIAIFILLAIVFYQLFRVDDLAVLMRYYLSDNQFLIVLVNTALVAFYLTIMYGLLSIKIDQSVDDKQ